MRRKLLIIQILLLSGCGTIRKHQYQVDTGDIPAAVEVDGKQVCDFTPCDITLTADLKYVGLAYSSNGYHCSGFHHVSVFPAHSPAKPSYAGVKKVNSCDYQESKKTIAFDVTIKQSEQVNPGQFSQNLKTLKYIALGAQNNNWHNPKNDALDSKTTDGIISYGQEIYKLPGSVFLGELTIGKTTSKLGSQGQAGVLLHAHYEDLAMFYLTGGLQYQKIENDFATDGLFPYVGFGLLLNHKTIREFWHIFKWILIKQGDFTYKVGEFNYDLFLETGVFIHQRMTEWDWQDLKMGLRIYY